MECSDFVMDVSKCFGATLTSILEQSGIGTFPSENAYLFSSYFQFENNIWLPVHMDLIFKEIQCKVVPVLT